LVTEAGERGPFEGATGTGVKSSKTYNSL